MRIGIDLGGTKIAAVALDADGGELGRDRVPTPREDYDATLAAIAELVTRLERRVGEEGTVGIGTPGTLSPATGRLKNANSTWLNGRAFDTDLSARLGRPVRCANDANCLALSEATDGAAAGARVVFGVILGTGVGGGLVMDGTVHAGRNGIAGEWGHNPLPWARDDEHPGPQCWCGQRGCIETWLSGTGLARDHRTVTGQELRGEDIVAAAAGGDRDAQATVERHVDRLARALMSVVHVLDPDVVVIGGGLSRVQAIIDPVGGRLAALAFGGEADTPVRAAAHGDDSGVRGAAWLWPTAAGADGGAARTSTHP